MPEVEVGAKRSMDEDDHSTKKHARSSEDRDHQEGGGEEEDIEVRLLLLERSCGAVIGKGGENISRLRNNFNVYVQMPSTRTVDRAFTVKGATDNCMGVVREILQVATQGPYSTNQQCEVELNLLVQTSMIGSILGKGGERIKEIREATHAKVKIYEECLPCSNERVIAIGGDENEHVLVALHTILNIIKEQGPQRSRARYYEPGNSDTAGSFGGGDRSGGRGGGGDWRNRSDSRSSRRNSDRDNRDHRDHRDHRGDNSSSLFTQLHTVMEITAPNDICGAIIGKGGGRVRDVRQATGATVSFSESGKDNDGDRIITISGTQSQVQHAQQLITQQCSKYAS